MMNIEMMNCENRVFVNTPRLFLRSVAEEDYPYFRNYLMDKEMDRLMLRSTCETEDDLRIGFAWFLHKEERAYVIIHRNTGEVIGNLTVYNHVPNSVAEQKLVAGKVGKSLSFAIASAFRRNGFMYEAVSAVIDHLFQVEKVDYINCGYLSYNVPSKAFQEKLKFVHLCTERFEFEGEEIEAVENILWNM